MSTDLAEQVRVAGWALDAALRELEEANGETLRPYPARYVLGFADFHAAEPELIGDAMEDERGGIPGFSQQLTTRGILTAANLIGQGWRLLFWERSSGTRYWFHNGAAEQIA